MDLFFGRRASGSFDIRKLDGTKISAGISYKKLELITKRKTYLIERRNAVSSPQLKQGGIHRANLMKNWMILGGVILAIVGTSYLISSSEPPFGKHDDNYLTLRKSPRMTEEARQAAELKRKEADQVAQERRARYAAGLPVEEKTWGDDLQQLFLKLTVTTTQEEFENYVAATNLFLNKDRLDCKVAFRETDAYFKRGTGGDYVWVAFDSAGVLSTAQYFNSETMREAVMGNFDGRAEYMCVDLNTGQWEDCAGINIALTRTVNLKSQ